VIQLVSFIAEQLGFEVPPEDVTIEHFGTVSLLAGYLDAHGVRPRETG
jgi:acyl carrier protein